MGKKKQVDLLLQLCVFQSNNRQSTWNKENRFIGWADTALTKEGEVEARVAGEILKRHNIYFDEAHTSFLKRAIKTALIVQDEMDQLYVPLKKDYRLNERSYGALVGMKKKECVLIHGKERVKKWRRSYDTRPPAMSKDHYCYPGLDPRYESVGEENIPLAESLKDTSKRSLSYWNEMVVPLLKEHKTLLICGHENNLRSLLKHVDSLSDEAIVDVDIPRAVPLMYTFDSQLRPIRLGEDPLLSGRYLGDAAEIQAIMERDYKQVYDTSIMENLEVSAGAPKFGQRYRRN